MRMASGNNFRSCISRSPAPPRYKQIEERRKSFIGVDWSSRLATTPDKLVKAGFYYIGPGDRVKCAFCYGVLKNWLPTDVAIDEHVEKFPECTFVQNIEKQTAVLSKNLRSQNKISSCISSGTLQAQYAKEKENRSVGSPRRLWNKTLMKMGYARGLIRRAEKELKRKERDLNLCSVLEEIHVIETIFSMNDVPFSHEIEEDSGSDSVSDTDQSGDEVCKLQSKLKAIENERDELHNQLICKVCLVNRIDTLFLTCRHFSTCKECADRVRDCPVCRELILGTVDVFMA